MWNQGDDDGMTDDTENWGPEDGAGYIPTEEGGTKNNITENYRFCPRCDSWSPQVTLPDGQVIGWYCGDCHAITTTRGKLKVFKTTQDDLHKHPT